MTSEDKALGLMFIVLIAEVVVLFAGPVWAYAPLHFLFMFSIGLFWYQEGKVDGEEAAYQNIVNSLSGTTGVKDAGEVSRG